MIKHQFGTVDRNRARGIYVVRDEVGVVIKSGFEDQRVELEKMSRRF